MSPIEPRTNCYNPNFFSDTLTPALEQRLPSRQSVAGKVLDHTTKIPTFFDTVATELCESGRMGAGSRDAVRGFLARSTTTAVITTGTVALGAVALAAGGAPLVVVGVGAAGVALLPPAVDWAAGKAQRFVGDLLSGVRSNR